MEVAPITLGVAQGTKSDTFLSVQICVHYYRVSKRVQS